MEEDLRIQGCGDDGKKWPTLTPEILTTSISTPTPFPDWLIY